MQYESCCRYVRIIQPSHVRSYLPVCFLGLMDWDSTMIELNDDGRGRGSLHEPSKHALSLLIIKIHCNLIVPTYVNIRVKILKCSNHSNVAKHVSELGKSGSSLVAPGGTLKEEYGIQ